MKASSYEDIDEDIDKTVKSTKLCICIYPVYICLTTLC